MRIHDDLVHRPAGGAVPRVCDGAAMTTRIAIVSDVHADVGALRDALAQAARLGCGAIWCAGDVVDYGRQPAETVALLQERAVETIRGNHDRWALGRRAGPRAERTAREEDATPTDALPDATLDALASFPLTLRRAVEGVRVMVAHGTPGSDMEGVYPRLASAADVERWLRKADADVLVVGHTHQAFELRAASGATIVNPGALLRDGAERVIRGLELDPATGGFFDPPPIVPGTFGVVELPARRFTVHLASTGEELEIPRLSPR